MMICSLLTTTAVSQTLAEPNYQAYLTIRYLLEIQEYQQAKILINQYLKKFPADPFILTEKAMVLRKLKGDTREIIKILKKSLLIYPDYFLSNYLMATTSFLQYLQNQEEQNLSQEIAVLDQSMFHLNKSIAGNPQYHQSFFWLGVIKHEKGLVISRKNTSAKGRQVFIDSNKQLEIANKIQPSPEAYYYMALNHEQLNNIPQKMRALKNILKFSPYDYDTLAQLSNIYLKNKNYKMAASYLEKLALIDPNNKKISYNYLFSLFAMGKSDKFLQASTTINISDSPTLQYAKAFFLYQNNNWREAENLIKSFASKDFKSSLLLANIYLKQYEYFKAYQVLDQIKKPHSQKLYLPLFLKILSRLNLNNKIIQLFETIEKNKNFSENLELEDYYIIFHSYIKTRQSQHIPQIIMNLRKRTNKSHPELNQLLFILNCLEKSMPLPAKDLNNELNLNIALHYLKSLRHYHRAVAVLRKSLKLVKNERLMVEMGSLYLQMKEYRKTENLMMKLRRKYTSSTTIKNFYAYFLAQQNRSLKLAKKMAGFCLKRDPENPAYLDTYGYILLQMGKVEEAKEFLIKAYNKNPLEPEIINHIIQYYQLTKNVDRVTEIYQHAIKHNVDFKNRLKLQLKNVEKSYN